MSEFHVITAMHGPTAWQVSWQVAHPGAGERLQSRLAHAEYEPAAGLPAPRETPVRDTGQRPTSLPPAAEPFLAHCVHRRCVPGHIMCAPRHHYGRTPL